MSRRNRPLRIDDDTRIKLKKLSHELSSIEEKDVAMGEIVSRVFKAPDIPKRLREGSITRSRT